ncbi:MAG: hypothetical protein E7508_03045 [Ruminococcus sp.]|nr:hypothetical protein [Ruminococcus sp.]
MNKFCMQCGKEIEKSANNCPFCGASQDTGFGGAEVNNKKNKDLLVPIVAIVSVILVVVIVVANLTILNNAYKEPIDDFFKAVETGDGDYFEDAFPEYMTEDVDEFDDLASKLNSTFKKVLGKDFEISYEVIEKEKIDDDDLEDLEKSIDKNYDESVSVSDGYSVEIELTCKSDSMEESITTKINVHKIDGDWCLTENFVEDLF